MKAQTLLKRISYLANLLKDYYIFSIQQSRKHLPSGRKSIVVTLDEENLYRDNDGDGRYAYLLLNRFSDAGYNVYFFKDVSLKGFAALRKYGRLIYSIKNLKFINQLPPNTEEMTYAFDTIRRDLLSHRWKTLTYVNILMPPFCQIGEMINIPYYFHPFIYHSGRHQRPQHYRANRRRMRIFFGGNTVREAYTNNQYHDLGIYNEMTRFEVIDHLLKKGGHRYKSITDFHGFTHFLNDPHNEFANECFILQTDKVPVDDQQDWMDTISKSDFFLCLSGVELPMCHHSIESMAVGTIPIISHPDWFFPGLEHGKNAIIYNGMEDLMAKLEAVFTMDPSRIRRMRHKVIEYYEKYLSPESFIDRYEKLPQSINTIMMHPRLIPKKKLSLRGQKFINDLRMLLGFKVTPQQSLLSGPEEKKVSVAEPFISS